MRHLRASLAALLALTLAGPLYAAEPAADDFATARVLLKEARQLRAAHDYKGALEKLRAAYALAKTAVTGHELAIGFLDDGELVEARETALGVVLAPPAADETEASDRARASCREMADDLDGRIPALRVIVQGASERLSLTIDGALIPSAAIGLPRRVDPGEHVVVAHDGERERIEKVTLAEREQKDVRLAFEGVPAPDAPSPAAPPALASPAPAAPPAPHASAIPYVGLGAAALTAAVGTATGILAFTTLGAAKSHCAGTACSADAQSGLDTSATLGNVSTFSFVAAGVLTVASVIVLLESPNRKGAGSLRPTLDGVEGRF